MSVFLSMGGEPGRLAGARQDRGDSFAASWQIISRQFPFKSEKNSARQLPEVRRSAIFRSQEYLNQRLQLGRGAVEA